jgi:hypothetical protein
MYENTGACDIMSCALYKVLSDAAPSALRLFVDFFNIRAPG